MKKVNYYLESKTNIAYGNIILWIFLKLKLTYMFFIQSFLLPL